jgi:hypothetical protein
MRGDHGGANDCAAVQCSWRVISGGGSGGGGGGGDSVRGEDARVASGIPVSGLTVLLLLPRVLLLLLRCCC